jgi:tetratricopeptide (TPR) repeat protein
MLYAHLHNSAGGSYFELNQLDIAREHMSATFRIRDACLDPDDPESEEEFGHVNQNLGMIESAAGNLDKAIEFLHRAQDIRAGLPIPDSDKKLHNLHMNLGRTYLLKGMIDKGQEQYQIADDIITEKFGKTAFIYAQ